MKKELISIILLLMFLELSITPQIFSKTLSYKEKNDELITVFQDDGDHFPCGYECWCYHAVVTLDNGEHWDAAATFVYFMNKTKNGFDPGVSFLRIRHWNKQTGKVYDSFRTDTFPGLFQTSKNNMDLIYSNSSAQGSYPNYHFHLEDDKNNIFTDVQLSATSLPFWGFEGITGGIVPWGVSGTGKGYYIPMLELNGTIIINGTMHQASGIAYFEHDFFWSDFAQPLAIYSLKEFFNCTKLMKTAVKWYLKEVSENKPEQNPAPVLNINNGDFFGWSWSWILFDNNWSIVMLRPLLLGFSQGANPMLLYLTKDGQNYSEIACGYWTNNQIKYFERADTYIPLSFNISAYKDDMELHLSFTPTTEMTELYNKDWAPFAKAETCTFYCCGKVNGKYIESGTTVYLNGSYSIEQSRWLSKKLRRVGYRALEITRILPPEGLGFSIRTISHRLGIESYLKIQFKPTFEIVYYVRHAP